MRTNESTTRALTLSLALVLLLSGCTQSPYRAGNYRPQPLPSDIAEYYSYPAESKTAEVELLAHKARYRLYQVRFPFTRSDFEPSQPTIEFEWYVSKTGPGPVILVNPIFGGDYPLEHSMCRFFAAHGYHVVMPHRETIKIAPEDSLEEIELSLRESVLRARQILDWVQEQPESDPARIYSFGISMGAITTLTLAAVEPRIRKHVAALAGGSIPDIILYTHNPLLKDPRERYLKKNKLTPDELGEQLRATIRTDPVLLAPYIDPEQLTLLISMFDWTIGRENSLRLWRALNRPQATFIPFGHYTALVALPYLKIMSIRAYRGSQTR